jgi:hypothetical protein
MRMGGRDGNCNPTPCVSPRNDRAQPSIAVPHGSAQVPLPLPNTRSLSGQTFYAQWLVLEASSIWPAATSNVLRVPLR